MSEEDWWVALNELAEQFRMVAHREIRLEVVGARLGWTDHDGRRVFRLTLELEERPGEVP